VTWKAPRTPVPVLRAQTPQLVDAVEA